MIILQYCRLYPHSRCLTLQQDCLRCLPLLYAWLCGSLSVREMKSFLEGGYILWWGQRVVGHRSCSHKQKKPHHEYVLCMNTSKQQPDPSLNWRHGFTKSCGVVTKKQTSRFLRRVFVTLQWISVETRPRVWCQMFGMWETAQIWADLKTTRQINESNTASVALAWVEEKGLEQLAAWPWQRGLVEMISSLSKCYFDTCVSICFAQTIIFDRSKCLCPIIIGNMWTSLLFWTKEITVILMNTSCRACGLMGGCKKSLAVIKT